MFIGGTDAEAEAPILGPLMQRTDPFEKTLMLGKIEGKRRAKSWLKTQHQKMKIVTSGSITSWQIDGEKVETVTDFIFLSSKITTVVTADIKLKDACSLEEKL